jgi:cyclopropane-fatty-acyl-phospholipid synthase
MRLLSRLLKQVIKYGTLRVYDPAGELHVFGGKLPGPVVTVRIHERSLPTRLLLNPELRLGEAYMDGAITAEEGSTIYDFLLLAALNRHALGGNPFLRTASQINWVLRRWHQANPIRRAAANARHHYDISVELYRLFLDEDLHYSCAYFRDPERDTLEEAQRNKIIHATAKLQLRPGMRVAEIGCGWGAFAIHMARAAGAHVTAINLSPEQLRVCRERAAAAGVADRIDFLEMDYRQLTGRFDRVVSVAMMEAVGIGHFDEYFGKIRDLLADDGYAFVHCIGRNAPPAAISPFFQKYIFPGAHVPALSEVFSAIERSGLWTCDAEILRLHYAYTIRHWRERFARNRAKAALIYGERFCRMWEIYLTSVELNFIYGESMVFQLLLAREKDKVPITRDFMLDGERAELRGRVGV